MPIKMLACDLDGTLLNSSSEISEENLEAIKKLGEGDVLFVPSTGRAYAELMPQLRENPDIRYYICSGGAVTYDKKTGDVIGEFIAKGCVSPMLDVLSGFDCWMIIHSSNQAYVQTSQITEERFDHYDLHPYLRDLATAAEKSESLDETIRGSDALEMIAVCFLTEEDAQSCEEKLKAIDGLSVLRGTMGRGIHNVEIVSGSACKGGMLLRLAEHLGFERDEIASVGDSTNDLSMIRGFKNGFAVANANEEVKKSASRVICSNDDHAIKYILEHFVKNP